ncbi:hypothetical protein RN607_03565 [Demequina capsici]|uniref:Uncharacterized protein n=1 Tax=Demequina capsici TaxID=3075620 RepID=A0AA96JBI1_9MICO|nr:hypothetical protein [Demequina sp. PMTSA13]WNM28093.1 hypothetical protein RN607_03565 [Demequina sp. PMTSA13]
MNQRTDTPRRPASAAAITARTFADEATERRDAAALAWDRLDIPEGQRQDRITAHLADRALTAYVASVVAKAPPLTADQSRRITTLLAPA